MTGYPLSDTQQLWTILWKIERGDEDFTLGELVEGAREILLRLDPDADWGIEEYERVEEEARQRGDPPPAW